MKIPAWPLLLLLLGVNQLLRSPFFLWEWGSKIELLSTVYDSAAYKTNSSQVEVLERPASDNENETVLVILPDMRSSIGFWAPLLKQLATESEYTGTIRMVEWYGRGQSEWKEGAIVFSDLDSLLNMTLSDVEGNVVLVGQGIGAQLAIRYAQQHSKIDTRVVAINAAGFGSPTLYPQTVAELKEDVSGTVGDQWLPQFVYNDWLEWLDNPFLLAIEKETHLVPNFTSQELESLSETSDITWVGFSPNEESDESTPVSSCTGQYPWTCTAELFSIIDGVLSKN